MTPDARLVVGCEQLGGTDWGSIDRAEAERAIAVAFDRGLTAYDTADVYGLGESERRLSHALGPKRHDAFIVTKGGVRWQLAEGRARTWKDNSAQYLTRAIEDSLRRLRRERIDMYFVHWPDGRTAPEAVVRCLEDARGEGKIAAFGLSNFPLEIVLECRRAGLDAAQVPFNLLSARQDLADLAAMGEAGLERYGYGALAQGFLTGKYDSSSRFNADDRRHRLPHFQPRNWPHVSGVLEQLSRAARQTGHRPADLAIQALRQSGLVDHVIVGIKSGEQALALAALKDLRVPDEIQSALFNAGRPDQASSGDSTD